MSRTEHIISSGLVLLLGVWVTWVSFTQEPADAFLFPRLIAVAFSGLAAWTFIKAVLGLSRTGKGLTVAMLLRLLPGLAVSGIYIFWAAKTLGFYTATAIGFFVLLSLYDPNPHNALRSWVTRLIITAIFVAVMYGLFAQLLKVYTPREIFF